MRITRIQAEAFGAMRGPTLDLGPGLNVIVGPNESGKSTWHAALYAALCGMPAEADWSDADRRFAAFRRPRAGAEWAVRAELELDGPSGPRRVALTQNLLDPLASTVVDLDTGDDLGAEITAKGGPDAARWLGFDRGSYAATSWIEQSGARSALVSADGRNALQLAVAACVGEDDVDAALAQIEAVLRGYIGEATSGVGARSTAAAAVARWQAERSQFEELQRLRRNALDRRATATAAAEISRKKWLAARAFEARTEADRLRALVLVSSTSDTTAGDASVPSSAIASAPADGESVRDVEVHPTVLLAELELRAADRAIADLAAGRTPTAAAASGAADDSAAAETDLENGGTPDDEAADEVAADEVAADEVAADEVAADEVGAGQADAAEADAEEAPADDAFADEYPAGDYPNDDYPNDDAPADNAPTDDAAADDSLDEDAAPGVATAADATTAEVTIRSAATGEDQLRWWPGVRLPTLARVPGLDQVWGLDRVPGLGWVRRLSRRELLGIGAAATVALIAGVVAAIAFQSVISVIVAAVAALVVLAVLAQLTPSPTQRRAERTADRAAPLATGRLARSAGPPDSRSALRSAQRSARRLAPRKVVGSARPTPRLNPPKTPSTVVGQPIRSAPGRTDRAVDAGPTDASQLAGMAELRRRRNVAATKLASALIARGRRAHPATVNADYDRYVLDCADAAQRQALTDLADQQRQAQDQEAEQARDAVAQRAERIADEYEQAADPYDLGLPYRQSVADAQWARDAAQGDLDLATAALAEIDAEIHAHPSAAAIADGLARAEATVARVERLDRVLQRTRLELTLAREAVLRDIASGLTPRLTDYLEQLTDRRFSPADTHDLHDRIGASLLRREPELGSFSTSESTYLFTRVALGQHLAGEAPQGPLLVDDITSSADNERIRRMLAILRRVSAQRQVVIFAHQSQVRTWALNRLGTDPNLRLIKLTSIADDPRVEAAPPRPAPAQKKGKKRGARPAEGPSETVTAVPAQTVAADA